MSTVTAPIFVTWTQLWNMDEYIDHYVRTRRLALKDDPRALVRSVLASYPGKTPYRKSDLDFYLDKNMGRSK